MKPTPPDLGLPQHIYGANQPQYEPIVVAVRPNENYPGAVEHITRWTFTDEERARIASGEDVFVAQISFTGAMTPIYVTLSQ